MLLFTGEPTAILALIILLLAYQVMEVRQLLTEKQTKLRHWLALLVM
jgi:hypothetical protein